MTVYERITWVPDVLRRAGLVVVEHDGWRLRGLSDTRPFTPRYLVWHHDASVAGDSLGVPAFMIRNFATAGAQLWVDRAGRWHIIAAGRAAHAGTVLAGKPDNETSIGVETDHTTGEKWPDTQLRSLRVGTAAILSVLGSGPEGLEFHKTICSPPGRKVDPAGLDLADERRSIALLITPGGDMQLTDKVKITDTESRTVAFLLRRSLLNAREQAAQIAALTEGVKVIAASGGGALPADFDARVRKAATAAVRDTLGSLDK